MAFVNGNPTSATLEPGASVSGSTGSSSGGDWLELFLDFTEGTPSPRVFRLWAGITAVAGVLERRVWAETGRRAIFPNLYTLLVAPPATGKDEAIRPAVDLWRSTRKLHLAPDDVTKASLVDAVAGADRKMLLNGTIVEYHTLLVPAPELGVLMNSYDLGFMSVLTQLYDNNESFRESRRTRDKQTDITHPQITLLAGSQPSFMASFFPDEAWDQGFTSRLIMIYATERPQIDLFSNFDPREAQRTMLVRRLTAMMQLYGKVTFAPDAKAELIAWYRAGFPPAPDHPKLIYYCGRRAVHIIKLCMVSAASRGDLIVTSWDLERVRGWLLAAEAEMPEVFHAMSGKSDSRVLDELYQFTWRMYSPSKKPVTKAALVNFLQRFAPVDKVFKLIYVAEQANMLDRVAGTETYIPRAKARHGQQDE